MLSSIHVVSFSSLMNMPRMLLDKLYKLRSRHPSFLLIGRKFFCNNIELDNYPGKCRICVLVSERILELGYEPKILGALSANVMGTLLRLVAPCNFLVSTCVFLISGKFSLDLLSRCLLLSFLDPLEAAAVVSTIEAKNNTWRAKQSQTLAPLVSLIIPSPSSSSFTLITPQF